MKQPVIEFQNVSVRYANNLPALRNINFEIAAGETLAIVGESGGGKTTIARAALGLLPPTAAVSGSIRIGDAEIVGASDAALRKLRGLVVGFVSQEPFSSFNPLSRIYSHIAEAWRAHNQSPPASFIIKSLEQFGIAEAKKSSRQFPHEWSGGMLQRATVVAANAHRPKLVVADEPTSALDANRADEILAAICRDKATAVLLVTHDLRLAAKYADRLAVCRQGEIVETGATAEVVKNPQHHYTKILLGTAGRDAASALQNLSSTHGEIVLEAKNLSRHYQNNGRTVRAVGAVNLQIRRREIVGIGGASGCGKSTLLRLLATIETPTGGEVFLDGVLAASGASKKVLSHKSRKGFVLPIFQNPLSSLDARWAVWRSITEPLTAAHRTEKFTKAERREIAARILTEVGLAQINLDARPKELSVGQCQRICVARALVARPALIVADEPTSALDVSTAKTIVEAFSKIAASGTAIVIVSHDELMLRSVCHRVLQMRDGTIEQ